MCNFPALVAEFHIIDSKLHAWLSDVCRCFLLVPCNYEPEIILYLYGSFCNPADSSTSLGYERQKYLWFSQNFLVTLMN